MPQIYDFEDLDLTPPEFTVDGLIPETGVGFGYGLRYTGKSLVAIEKGLAVANGTEFFGRKAKQGGVIWCIAEGEQDAGVRIMARLARERADRMQRHAELARRHGREAADAWLMSLPPYTAESFKIMPGAFELKTRGKNEPTEALLDALAKIRSKFRYPRLVIIDPVRYYSRGSIIQDTPAAQFMDGMKWLSDQLGCVVEGIAHPVRKRDTDSGYGLPGEVLANLSDFIWWLQPGESDDPDRPSAAIVPEKVKSGPLPAPIPFIQQRIQWAQQPADEYGDPLDVPQDRWPVLKSVTIRLAEEPEPEKQDRKPRREIPLPVVEEVPSDRPARRTGIKRRKPFRLVSPEGSSDQSEQPPGQPEDLTARLLAEKCPECQAGPGTSCTAGKSAVDYLVLDIQPLVLAHIDRAGAAIAGGRATEAEVLERFERNAKAAEPAGTAAVPAQAAS